MPMKTQGNTDIRWEHRQDMLFGPLVNMGLVSIPDTVDIRQYYTT